MYIIPIFFMSFSVNRLFDVETYQPILFIFFSPNAKAILLYLSM